MATPPPFSPGPAAWKDDLTPLPAADWNADRAAHLPVSYTHLTLPTNREV